MSYVCLSLNLIWCQEYGKPVVCWGECVVYVQNKNSLLMIREPWQCQCLVAQSPYPRSDYQLRYLRRVMSRTNMFELHINNLPLLSFSWQDLHKPSIKPNIHEISKIQLSKFYKPCNQSQHKMKQINHWLKPFYKSIKSIRLFQRSQRSITCPLYYALSPEGEGTTITNVKWSPSYK